MPPFQIDLIDIRQIQIFDSGSYLEPIEKSYTAPINSTLPHLTAAKDEH